MLDFNLKYSIKEYQINSRAKLSLETNLNNLLDLGIEGTFLDVEEYSEIINGIITKIKEKELNFSSKEKRVIALVPGVMIEKRSSPISVIDFDEILSIVSKNAQPKRLIISFVKTSLNHHWTAPKLSSKLIEHVLIKQRENDNLKIFNENVLEDLTNQNSHQNHAKLIDNADGFNLLNAKLGLPRGWRNTEYHCLVLGDCILRSADFKNEYGKYRELVHTTTRNYQTAFMGSLYLISALLVAGENIQPIQNSLKRLALDHVGDPSITLRWKQISNYNKDQKKLINQACDILNFWITRDFLTIFFERCLNDIRRKRFWLQYAHRIKDFKVYTHHELKRELLSDPRIKGLSSRIKVFGTGRISAIVMSTASHDLVEFSDDGWAFRAYLVDNQKWRSVMQYRFIESAEILRSIRLPMAVRRRAGSYYDWKKSGTLHHRDATYNWESTFKSWLERTAL